MLTSEDSESIVKRVETENVSNRKVVSASFSCTMHDDKVTEDINSVTENDDEVGVRNTPNLSAN